MAKVFYGNTRPYQQDLPYTGVQPRNPTLEECSNANGGLNDSDDDNGLIPVGPYVPPDLCLPTFTITQGDCAETENTLQEENAAGALEISGAPVNVFKYLGVHEQGKLIDLIGHGKPVGSESVAAVFDSNAGIWESNAKGIEVVKTPSYIGYDFGVMSTSFGSVTAIPNEPNAKMITRLRIHQPDAGHRAVQLRVDRSTGKMHVDPHKIHTSDTNIGNGVIAGISVGPKATVGVVMLVSEAINKFTVTFIPGNGPIQVLGTAEVGKKFLSHVVIFTIAQGAIDFVFNDTISFPIEIEWQRADVVNVPNVGGPVMVDIKQSAPSRYWRIVPIIFQGVTTPTAGWRVNTLEMFEVGLPTLDDIQDPLFMENRDRDYAKTAIRIKAAYQPFDSVSDLSKFGFQIADIYTFTTTFATMVKALGRPVVIGDVLELPSEVQYDHHLRPVRKFLEVTDTGWAADGYTTGWKPIIFKFQAQPLIPGQEHQSLFGNIDTQLNGLTDEQSFLGLNNRIQTAPLTTQQRNEAEAKAMVSQTGVDNQEFASGAAWVGKPGSYDRNEPGMANAIPPDGQPYETGFKLPDVQTAQDRDFFRLEYDPQLNMPARLYQFSSIKGTWIFIESDKRKSVSSHRGSKQRVFDTIDQMSPMDTKAK